MKKTKQTKFPVARIKKIMQTDEDVGKVAMATPVLVSKALELFMASLVGAAAEETRSAGSKKMTPYHLKRTILNTPMFDFLHEQVAGIPDPVASTSSTAAAGGKAAAGGAARGGGGRKKKAAPSSSPEGSSSEGDSSEDDDAAGRRRPPPSAGKRPTAKKAKVEIPGFGKGPSIPALPTVSGARPLVPSVFAPPPPLAGGGGGGSYGSGVGGLPMYAPGMPPVPGPTHGGGVVKQEGSESESGSSEEDE